MPIKSRETIIISLGGSVMAPNEIDVTFLKNFKHSIKKYLGEKRFLIIVGGGKIARNYQNALLEFGAKNNDRDWIGINVTRLNAQVLKQVFAEDCHKEIIVDPNKKIKTLKNIIVGGGYKPGWSTDYVSVLLAKNYGVKTIINLSNIDFVCDKNPCDFPEATPLKDMDWSSFRRIVGDVWSPGLSMPFDPRASKLAASLKLKVAIMNGKKLDRFENYLDGKPFIGTTIQ